MHFLEIAVYWREEISRRLAEGCRVSLRGPGHNASVTCGDSNIKVLLENC